MSTAALGYAPQVEALIEMGELSPETADLNRRLTVVIGDFIVNRLARDPLTLDMFASNDRRHFIEGFQAQRQHFERLWVMHLADHLTH